MRHEPHHDGSPRHVSNPAPALGEAVEVFLRVPRDQPVRAVHLRTTPDAEPGFDEARIDRTTETEVWWRATVEVRNRVAGYRFLITAPDGRAHWVNAAGTHDRDVTDTDDFRLVADHGMPDWVPDAVLYQVFPDRFATSGAERDVPPWFDRAAWDDPVVRGGPEAMRQLYGGDLPGIEQHLDHLVELGVTGVYLNPIFPSTENHRYCASSFDTVDPLLGGDEALAALATAMHARGLRLIGDLTANHSGDTHPWFTTARSDPDSAERGFYHWLDYPDEYEAWAGVASLPKFDHRSAELRRRLCDGPDSVVGRWLAPPFGLDGWRIDAANMSGRCGAVDVAHDLARDIRRTIEAVGGPDAYLLAEHCHHAAPDLDTGGWHGTMNYLGFTAPVWGWLRDPAVPVDLVGLPFGPARRGAAATVATYREANAEFSWLTRLASLNPLGSHDTSRFRTVVNDDDRFRVGVALMLTLPGVPSILYGDEVGLEGPDNEGARRPMPWDPDDWHRPTWDWYRTLVRLRRDHAPLRSGGLRFLHADGDALTFVRETVDAALLVHVTRTAARVSLTLPSGRVDGRDSLVDGGVALQVEDGALALTSGGAGVGVWPLT